jgi:tRNA/rRNA methyltransferase
MTPAVILVRPQLGVNIGTAARAMLNCGLDDLRLVAPREGWPNAHAWPAASGAVAVLEKARVFASLDEATGDLTRLYATTWRGRGLVKWIFTPAEAARDLRQLAGEGGRSGLLFGPERTGLENEDLARVDAIVSVPLNPAFPSLNLAQAVLLIGYEWWMAGNEAPARRLEHGLSPLAGRAAIDNFIQRLVQNLDETGFFHPPEKREHMVRNLEACFGRLQPTEQELRTLFGAIKALRYGPYKKPDEPI